MMAMGLQQQQQLWLWRTHQVLRWLPCKQTYQQKNKSNDINICIMSIIIIIVVVTATPPPSTTTPPAQMIAQTLQARWWQAGVRMKEAGTNCSLRHRRHDQTASCKALRRCPYHRLLQRWMQACSPACAKMRSGSHQSDTMATAAITTKATTLTTY